MAEYHLTLKNISRVNGRNAVKSAAYRHGKHFRCNQTQDSFNYSKKKDIEHCEISIPENSPKWAKALLELDPNEASQKLWNAVEAIEKRKDARLAKEVEFSLPHELTKEQRLVLAREFIQENFTSKGMIADWAVHNHFDEKDGIEKPHVHVMLTTRFLKESISQSIQEKGKEETAKEKNEIPSKQEEILEYQGIAFGEKDRSWNQKSLLHTIRQNWEVCANRHLEKAGLDVRIDHRSYKDRGIDLEAQPKIGKGTKEMASRGYHIDRLEDLERIKARNRALIHKNPDLVLDYITRQQSVFTRQDIARVVNRYVDQREEARDLLARIEASPQLIRISDDQRRGQVEQRFTTQEMIDLEVSLIKKADLLKDAVVGMEGDFRTKAGFSFEQKERFILDANLQMAKGQLSSDQVHAIDHMTNQEQLKVVVGYAGAGKSTCLKVAKDIWEDQGYRVVGAAPTGKATDNLEGTGIASKTLHKWEHEWRKEQSLLSNNDILVVDEAGMIDSRRLNSLLGESQQYGFKVVLIGDPEQLSPIEAGCGLRTVMDKAGFVQIHTIQRQIEEWQKEATKELATQQTKLALKRYEEKGYLHLEDKAKDKLMEDYAKHVQSKLPEESLDAVILAYTNKDVQDLSTKARLVAKASGRLQGPDHLLTITRYRNRSHGQDQLDQLDSLENNYLKTIKEEKAFAVGDQIVFLRNDYGIGVKNGQFGIIQDIDEGMIRVQLEKKHVINFDLSLYSSFDHGYATTIHKSQSSTIEKTFFYASQGMDRHLTYVGLSRHRAEVNLYAEKDAFKTKENLYDSLSRENLKENVFDYVIDDQALQHLNVIHPSIESQKDAFYFSGSPSPSSSSRSLTVLEKVNAWIEDTVDKTRNWLEQRQLENPLEEKTIHVSVSQTSNSPEKEEIDASRLHTIVKNQKAVDPVTRDISVEKGIASRVQEGSLKKVMDTFEKASSLDFDHKVSLNPSLSPSLPIPEKVVIDKKDQVSRLEQGTISRQENQAQPKTLKEGLSPVLEEKTLSASVLVSPPPLAPTPASFRVKSETHKVHAPSPSYQQERYDSILSYLKEEVCLDKHVWLKESSLDFFLKDADKYPLKALKRWQDVSGDKSFIPMSLEEARLKSQKAHELLEKARFSLPQQDFENLSQDLPSHASGIFSKCQKALEGHQERQRETDVQKFMDLSQKYQKYGPHTFSFGADLEEKQAIRKGLHELSTLYQKDEMFLKKIEGIPDKSLKDFAVEIFKNPENLQKDLYRGFEKGMGLSFEL